MKREIKNKAIYIILAITIIVGLLVYHKLYSDSKHGKALAKLTVVITDEDGNVIPDADASVTFDLMAGWTESRSYTKRGKTNEQGEFSATYRTLDKVFVGAKKENYYYSNKQVKFKNPKGIKWQPWNPTVEVVLREKVDPIPLYAKHYSQHDIPANNKKIGYDFFVGDWCEPYGEGITNDIYISYDYEVSGISDFKWSLQISAISSNDGFICIEPIKGSNSVFKLPYLAPIKTYSPKYIQNITVSRGKRHYTKPIPISNNIFFRIRSDIDNNGNVTNCFYGKITNIESALARDRGIITFTYYLNPTPNDRNLEFNVESNLFQNLKRSEEVRQP
jgi:hypothetical protein